MQSEFIGSHPLAASVASPARVDGTGRFAPDSGLRRTESAERAPDSGGVHGRPAPSRPIAADAGGANLDDELALASTEACHARSDDGTRG